MNRTIKTYMDGLLQTEISKQEEDLKEILEIENLCWQGGGEMVANKEKFRIRQENDVLIATRYIGDEDNIVINGKEKPIRKSQILGHLTAYPAKWTNAGIISLLYNSEEKDWKKLPDLYLLPKNWHAATLNGWLEKNGKSIIDKDSNVVHLISTCVHPDYRGRIGESSIIDSEMNSLMLNSKNIGARYVIGYTTLPGYKEFCGQFDPNDYTFRKVNGKFINQNINYHARNGAKIVCDIPDCMPEDVNSSGFGALVIYRLF